MKETSRVSQVLKCDILHQKKNRVRYIQSPSRKEVEAELEKIMKLYECYCFAVSNADDEYLRKKIIEISREHLLAKIDAMKYSVLIAIQIKKDELRKKIAELGKG